MSKPVFKSLFKPIKIGNLNLNHRIAMAPLTRMRTIDDTGIVSNDTVEYYSQRANEGGLLITEAVAVAEEANGMIKFPGFYTNEQIQKWKTIVDKVHEKGCFIFCQLIALG